jgi:hypothetical protein
MPPLEAAACGTPLILGPFYKDRMPHVFGELAQYATTSTEMREAILRVAAGKVVRGEFGGQTLGCGRVQPSSCALSLSDAQWFHVAEQARR